MTGESNEVKWRGVQPVDGIRGVWPARNATRIYKRRGLAGAGEEIIYTVPAVKVLFITSSYLASRNAAAQLTFAAIGVRDGGDVNTDYLNRHYYSIVGYQSGDRNFMPGYEVPAGYDVTINCAEADVTAFAGIAGWLEDA